MSSLSVPREHAVFCSPSLLTRLLITLTALCSPFALNAIEAATPLEVWGINSGILQGSKTWKFRQSVAGNDLQSANAADPSLDDSDWQDIDLRWREFPGPAVGNHFRKQFTLDEIGVTPSQIKGIEVSLQYDDTAVLYLNGIEVYRSIRGNLDPDYSLYPPGGNIPYNVDIAFGGFENFYVEIPNTNGTNTCETDANCGQSPYDGPNPPAIPVSLLQDGINTWAVTTWTRSVGGSGDSSLNHTFTLLIDDAPVTTAPVYINEVMASNDTVWGVELDGAVEFPDWFELYNDSATPINVQGWTIADNSAAWEFPAVTIPAFGYLVVAANDEDRNDTTPLQTNFKISTEGDSLRLTDPNGFIADEYASIPAQAVDGSWGRPNDNTTELDYLAVPTPGATNSAAVSGSSPTLQLFTDKIYNLGEPVSEQVDAFDADGDSLSYELAPKPPGIDIDDEGKITGTATAAGTFDSVISVTDSNDNTTTQNVSFIVLPAPSSSPALVLNEYNAVSESRQLSAGSSIGNGGNWFEFVVVEDQLDLRGMTITLYDNQGPDDQFRLASELTFVNNDRLSALPAGLIITISEETGDDLTFDNLTDWHVNFQVDGSANGAFIVSSGGDFDSSHEGQAVLIKNAAGEIVAPLSGETAAWDDANGGVSSKEAMTLCFNPVAGFTLDPVQHYADIGTASSFGAENICPIAGGTTFVQNLDTLRFGSLPATITTSATIRSGNDDAEERSNGDMYLDSSDIELTEDSAAQTVGLRFTNLAVPAGAVIESAYIQFQVDETNSGTTQLIIAAEASSNAAPFVDRDNNISSRSRTATSIKKCGAQNWNIFNVQIREKSIIILEDRT